MPFITNQGKSQADQAIYGPGPTDQLVPASAVAEIDLRILALSVENRFLMQEHSRMSEGIQEMWQMDQHISQNNEEMRQSNEETRRVFASIRASQARIEGMFDKIREMCSSDESDEVDVVDLKKWHDLAVAEAARTKASQENLRAFQQRRLKRSQRLEEQIVVRNTDNLAKGLGISKTSSQESRVTSNPNKIDESQAQKTPSLTSWFFSKLANRLSDITNLPSKVYMFAKKLFGIL